MAADERFTVLMVAEKPSIAATMAQVFGGGQSRRRKGISPSSPVHEYDGTFRAVGFLREAHFKVTSTVGHMWSLDFPKEYNQQQNVAPIDLFSAPTVHLEDPRPRMSKHLGHEAQTADVLVLWLDCDREGENICFEVIQTVQPHMRCAAGSLPGAYPDAMGRACIYRAAFSSLAPVDLMEAMENLVHPNYDESSSVDARQCIDLKLGVAFSRFQTQFFREHFKAQLGKLSVTYGPCQTPTLWFIVQRHDVIATFQPKPFWNVGLEVNLCGARNGEECTTWLNSVHGDMWEEDEASAVQRATAGAIGGSVVSAEVGQSVGYQKPLPLNTVALLRAASDTLGISPGDAIHFAEKLYLSGFTSYPRTETTKYADAFDLSGTLSMLAGGCIEWLREAKALLLTKRENGSPPILFPREDGVDVGDHPPITPIKIATAKQCGGAWPVYQLICKHFVGSVSDDCELLTASLTMAVENNNANDNGGDDAQLFSTTTTKLVEKGWTEVMGVHVFGGKDDADEQERASQQCAAYDAIEALRVGQILVLTKMPSTEKKFTQPPPHLSEGELLGLMEAKEIGTDASMASHVSNVIRRGYAILDEETRSLVPSALGLALIHAYMMIDEGLVLPSVRANIEANCKRIALGTASFDEVVNATLGDFRKRFERFTRLAHRIPLMLAVALDPECVRVKVGVTLGSREGKNTGAVAESKTAGWQMWIDAVNKTAACQLDAQVSPEASSLVASSSSASAAHAELEEGEVGIDAVLSVQAKLEALGYGAAVPETSPPPRMSKKKEKTKKAHKASSSATCSPKLQGGEGGVPKVGLSAAAPEWKPNANATAWTPSVGAK